MKIVLEFDNIEELQQELYRWAKATRTGKLDPVKQDPDATVQKTADIINAAEAREEAEKQKVVQFEKKAEPAPEIMPEPTPEPAPAPQVDESYRIEVRKTLAKLNKKTGENTASKLIQGFGVDKLTGVALKDLPELMRQAEEALNA